MGAPLLSVSALGSSLTGRRAARAFLYSILFVMLIVLTPLLLVPLALVGYSLPSSQISSVNTPVTSGEWGYPLAGEYGKGRGYGYGPVVGCSYCSTDHKGYDMGQGCGSTIYAAGSGVVITAGSHSGYGNTVRVDHGDGLETLYGHMAWDSLRVSVGDPVVAGTALGDEGKTGKSWGCHLHYEVRENGRAIDPQPFMAALGLPLK